MDKGSLALPNSSSRLLIAIEREDRMTSNNGPGETAGKDLLGRREGG